MDLFLNLIIMGRVTAPFPIPHPHNFSKVIFVCKIGKITVHVNPYPECAKKYIEVNEALERIRVRIGIQSAVDVSWLVPVFLWLATGFYGKRI